MRERDRQSECERAREQVRGGEERDTHREKEIASDVQVRGRG